MSVPDQLGDFRVVEEIGRGGFGIVYHAHQVSLDRPVALKVLFRHLIHTQEQISRFEREARAAARLDHPALVSVYAWGEDKDDFYIAQRLIGHGRTLEDELTTLREGEGMPKGWFRRVASLLIPVAEGLQQAHDRGIVHRDVKPSNILLDDEGHPNLGDFGLAKVEDGLELSRTGDFAGSPFYMSPEQADSRRGEVDHRSDIYSMGVTLYEMLTLAQPFQGQTSHEIVRKILTEEPITPGKIEDRVPADLETICVHAMERSPLRRYQSALELAHDLQAFLDGEPINAVPIGATRRLVRKVRRHGPTVALAGMALALVVITWMFSSSQGQARQQKQERETTVSLQQDLKKNEAEEKSHVEEVLGPQIEKAIEAGDDRRAQQLEAERQQRLNDIGNTYLRAKASVMDVMAEADPDRMSDFVTAYVSNGWQGALGALGIIEQPGVPEIVTDVGPVEDDTPLAPDEVADAEEQGEDVGQPMLSWSPLSGFSVQRGDEEGGSPAATASTAPAASPMPGGLMPVGPPIAIDGRTKPSQPAVPVDGNGEQEEDPVDGEG